MTGHFQGLYHKDKDQNQNFSAKDKNQDQIVKDTDFTSVLKHSFRTRTNIAVCNTLFNHFTTVSDVSSSEANREQSCLFCEVLVTGVSVFETAQGRLQFAVGRPQGWKLTPFLFHLNQTIVCIAVVP